jgi:hypothetical protein
MAAAQRRAHLEHTDLIAGMVLVTDHVHGAHYAIEDVGPYWEVRRLGTGIADTIVSTHDSLDDALDSL